MVKEYRNFIFLNGNRDRISLRLDYIKGIMHLEVEPVLDVSFSVLSRDYWMLIKAFHAFDVGKSKDPSLALGSIELPNDYSLGFTMVLSPDDATRAFAIVYASPQDKQWITIPGNHCPKYKTLLTDFYNHFP